MNERIKELAEQAGFSKMGIWKIIGIEEYHEKFAELIVKECVEGIERNGWYWNSSSVDELCRKIENHFGVE